MKTAGGLSLSIILLACHVFAQGQREQKVEPYPCESNNATLNNAQHLAGEKELLIFIGRLGDGESKREINRRRLHNARAFLTSTSFWNRDPKTVVVAEGERVNGYGRVEIYIKGRLFEVIAARRNGDLIVGSCYGEDRDLYPFRDRPRSRKKVER